jgi:F-type H+-transporting ATPase subunit c
MLKRLGLVLPAVTLMLLASPLLALAQEAASATASSSGLRSGLIAVAANIGVGIAALGCGLGQGKLSASVMESIGRNPNSAGQLFTPMVLCLAFVESLTIYALVIALILVFKV